MRRPGRLAVPPAVGTRPRVRRGALGAAAAFVARVARVAVAAGVATGRLMRVGAVRAGLAVGLVLMTNGATSVTPLAATLAAAQDPGRQGPATTRDAGSGGSAAAPDPTSPGAAGEAPSSPPPVTVEATVSRQEVTVGETFAVDVVATGPPGTEYVFPAGASEDSFELTTPGLEPGPAAAAQGTPAAEPGMPAGGVAETEARPTTESGSTAGDTTTGSAPTASGTHRYEAAVFALGEVSLPPVPVRYRLPDGTVGEARTEPVTVTVVSMLPKDPDEQKLADVHGPRPATIGAAFWAFLVVAVVLLAALSIWLWRRRRPAAVPGAAAEPELPPDVEALAALGELARSGLLAGGAFRTFYIRLTGVAKRYLERRLEAPVLEMTTAETLVYLSAHAHGAELLPVVRDLAEAADRIKFARGQGLGPEAERHLAAVRSLVRRLEARLRPAQPERPEGKAA